MEHLTSPRYAAFVLAFSAALAACGGGAVVGADASRDTGPAIDAPEDAAPPADTGPRCPASQTLCGDRCVDLQGDRAHCGTCDAACAAGLVCSAGRCGATCAAPLTLCAGDAGAGGVCVDARNDPANCGACGSACRAGERCVQGRCEARCPGAQVVCAEQCVDTSSNAQHCGGCGTACAGAQQCVRGACELVCATGQTACGGACVSLATDNANCGACGAACAGGQRCAGGACTLVCAMGQTRCGDACVSLATDNANCGACGTACAGGQRCVGGACTLVCATGQAACGGACVNLATDNAHCGACGRLCPAGTMCSAGACAPTCAAGYTRCGGACADTNTDASHCGTCGRACALASATAACVMGACAVGACVTGFGDCDRVAANGCEVDTRTSSAHCGACGRACGAGESCAGGTCATTLQRSCRAVLMSGGSRGTGTYMIDPDGAGPLPPMPVFCDMMTDGGGWTLLEVGRASGTNLRTRNAVGTLASPTQATSAKLSRAAAAAILMAGERRIRMGGRYGYLYLGPFMDGWLVSGYGAPGYGTVVTAGSVSLAIGGATYPGSRLAWPIDGLPAGCLNSDGSTSECGGGLHLGTWAFDNGDNVYVNHSPACCNLDPTNQYEVWGR